MEKEEKQLQIDLSPEIAEGIYSNFAVIAHSPSDFVVDFIRMVPGVQKAQVKSRIIMTPENAKRLLLALEDNIKKYESVYGQIKLNNAGNYAPPMPIFGGGGDA